MYKRDKKGRFIKGSKGSVATYFKKLNNHPIYRPIGSERIDERGAVKVKVAERKWRPKHILVWEKYHDPLKSNELIMCLDGNKQNCDISNLEKVSYSENYRMNERNLLSTNPQLTMANLNKLRLEDAVKVKKKGRV